MNSTQHLEITGIDYHNIAPLRYPFKPKHDDSLATSSTGAGGSGTAPGGPDVAAREKEMGSVLTGVKGKTWFAGTELDAPRDADGNFKHGWHWNMPYSVRRDLPDW